MKKVFIFHNFIYLFFVVLSVSCTSLSQDKFIDETYPEKIYFLSETEFTNGKIIYENKHKQSSENFDRKINEKKNNTDLKISVKNGMKYPVSNPLLALDDITVKDGSLNVFFTPFSGEDRNLIKCKYKVFFTIANNEEELNQSILIYKDNRGRQYLKKTFKVGNVSYKFQNSFSNFYVKLPYMFCEIANGNNIYKVFAVDNLDENYLNVFDSKVGEKRFIEQCLKNKNQKYAIVLNDSLVASFTNSEYKLYAPDSEDFLKKSIVIILSIFRFIENYESKNM